MTSYIGKDNPNFSNEKQKNIDYDNQLQAQVKMLAIRDPLKYLKYQSIGDSYMNLSYDLESGIDLEGENIQYKKIKKLIEDGYIEILDISIHEKYLLEKYGY